MAASGYAKVPSLSLEVHQIQHLAGATCSSLIIPISKDFHQYTLLHKYLRENNELAKTILTIVKSIKSEKVVTIRDEKLDKYLTFVPVLFCTNKTKFALAGGMLNANLNGVKKIGIVYPGPFFCTIDFANSFYHCLFETFMEKVLKEKQNISLEEIQILVQEDEIFASLQEDLVDIGKKVLLEKQDGTDMLADDGTGVRNCLKCTNCGEEMSTTGRLCKGCLDRYPSDPVSSTTPKFTPTDDVKKKKAVGTAPKPSKEKEAEALIADTVRYVREDFRVRFADHHLDKLIAEKVHSFFRFKLNISSERMRKYLLFWLVGYKAGSFVGGCIPTMGMVPNPIAKFTCGVGLGSAICGCVGCHEMIVKMFNPES